ncbi:MAG: hypothetical protein LIO59_06050 [Oscillospiraceae bacterium]|nr:hypothetical protein [Oscillospiraceae bacterium]
MRDSMKITIRYQYISMLLMQLAASGAIFVFGMVAFWYFLSQPVWKEILSVVFIAVNFGRLYVRAKRFAVLDNKPYTPLKPSKIKGVLFGVVISAVTLILFLLFEYVWTAFRVDDGIVGVFPTVVNVVFYFWSFPYNGIMGLSHGMMTWYSAALMLAVPIAACTLGYIAGCKNIEVIEKLEEYMYEKE